jgi:hypothetical protein
MATAIHAGAGPTWRRTRWLEAPAGESTKGFPINGLPCSTKPAWQFEQQ